MPAAWPWFDRTFDFSFPPEKHPDILVRLRGTPLRLQERVRGLSPDVCVRRRGDSWSIQENVGHIADVEPLWLGRMDDILAGTETMRAARVPIRDPNPPRREPLPGVRRPVGPAPGLGWAPAHGEW